MKRSEKIIAAIIGLTAAVSLASCSGSSESDTLSAREDRTTTATTTTTAARRTDDSTETTTERRDTVSSVRDEDSSGSFMSQAESKLDEVGDDVADGIDTTLSTAGDVADAILR